MKQRQGLRLGVFTWVALLGLVAPAALDSQSGDRPPARGERPPQVRVDVDLVLVTVTVTDNYNRVVSGLSKEHFEVFEDKQAQEILYFSNEDAPISLGLVFDVSGSMGSSGKLDRATKAAVQFLETANPQDEFFLVQFSDDPKLAADFSSNVEELRNRLLYARADGRTALLDALYLALDTMRKSHNPKKALLVISDGGDNRSRYGVKDIKAAVRESDVQIYAIGIFDPVSQRDQPEIVFGPMLLREMSEMTGGRLFPVELYNIHELPDVAAKISIELRNQYVLGYRPTNKQRDGGWRKIKVKLNPPKGLPPLTTNARAGYYAPTQ